MWRLSMSDGSELADADLDEAARAAAIAKMAQRLAAASPRKRPRARPHRPAPGPLAAAGITNIWLENAAAADEVVSGAGTGFIPPLQGGFNWRDHIGAARRIGVLGAMGVCGFALVVLAQSPDLARILHHPAHPETASLQTASAAPVAMPAPTQAPAPSVATPQWLPVGPATTTPARATTSPNRNAIAAAPPKPAMREQHVPQTQRSSATASLAPAAARGRHPVVHAAPVLVARAEAKPAVHRETIAQFNLPSWVTQPPATPRPAPQRPLIMSPPPRDLALPAPALQVAALANTPKARQSVTFAKQSATTQPIVVAASGYPPAAPYARPEFHAFEPPRFGWYGGTEYPYYTPEPSAP